MVEFCPGRRTMRRGRLENWISLAAKDLILKIIARILRGVFAGSPTKLSGFVKWVGAGRGGLYPLKCCTLESVFSEVNLKV